MSTHQRIVGAIVAATVLVALAGCGDTTSEPASSPSSVQSSGTSAVTSSGPSSTAITAPVVSADPAGTPITSGAPDPTRPDRTTPPRGSFDPTATLPREGFEEGDPGTVSVAITQPVQFAGWAVVPVACSVSRRTYQASFLSAVVVEGLTVSAEITAVNYTGPGTYPAVGSITLVIGGETYQVPVAAQVAIAADLAGTLSVATTVNTNAVAITLAWHCSV